MSSYSIFAPSYVYIDGQLTTFLNARLSAVISEVSGPLRLAVTLYVILYGVAILRGSISEPLLDFAVRSLKLSIIVMLATTTAYSTWVTQPLFSVLPNTLAQAISGGNVANVGASFDQFLGYGSTLGTKISNGAGFNIGSHVVAGVVFLVTAVSAALGFGVVMIAKVALALLVTTGPIFIACALFDATRRYFFGWLSQAVNYLTLFALIITVFELVLALVQQQWPSIDGQESAEVAGMLFSALCILGAIFFLQTPAIAAGIAGGASAGLADFGAVAGSMISDRSARAPSSGAPPPRTGGSMSAASPPSSSRSPPARSPTQGSA